MVEPIKLNGVEEVKAYLPDISLERLDSYENAKAYIYPVLRSDARIEQMNSYSDTAKVLSRPAMPGIQLSLTIDLGDGLTCITDTMLDEWGKTFDEVFEECEVNLRPVIMNMSQRLGFPLPTPFFIVTREDDLNGSASIMLKTVRETIGSLIGDDFYILPSSIHEVLCVPVSVMPPNEAQHMVKSVNTMAVDEREQLSDHVYICRSDSGYEIELAA